ncbi:CatB-related O-acetyltransferase [Moraxella oblonga]|uniref:CatB-related O-acetyltransferase n=1 Tax=Moraxella oblonga TaxID=200413 RepID=UPI0008314C35|nr:CatB-related O-acetyltransferase [Moraxella oblonga]
MILKINEKKLAEMGAVLRGVSNLHSQSYLEPPFVFAGNIAPTHYLSIGAFSYTQGGSFVNSEIGRYCSFAEEIVVGATKHPTDWLSTAPFQYREDPWGWFSYAKSHQLTTKYKRAILSFDNSPKTIIGNDVWIGRKAIIMPGIKVGNGAIIGAGAVVTKNVPDYAIVAGVPAKIIKYRFPEIIIDELLSIKWWQYGIWDLENIDFSNILEAIHNIKNMKNEITPYSPQALDITSFKTE